MDRATKERKLIALMVRDLGTAEIDEGDMVKMIQEVAALSEAELDRTLASRMDLRYPVDADVLKRALDLVDEPERLSQGYTGAPDMSHEGRPEERKS
ncbi:hypothetical protein BH23ACT11_BH23ACT11_29290 [soil metagenome]